MNTKTIENFTAKLNANAAALQVATKMVVDPGKFGRIKGTVTAKYAVCRILNPIFAERGAVTVQEVTDAFRSAAL